MNSSCNHSVRSLKLERAIICSGIAKIHFLFLSVQKTGIFDKRPGNLQIFLPNWAKKALKSFIQ